MLVLTRRTNEQILLPDLGVEISIIKTKGNQVRLGITAPKRTKILRGELMYPEDDASPITSSSQACWNAENEDFPETLSP